MQEKELIQCDDNKNIFIGWKKSSSGVDLNHPCQGGKRGKGGKGAGVSWNATKGRKGFLSGGSP